MRLQKQKMDSSVVILIQVKSGNIPLFAMDSIAVDTASFEIALSCMSRFQICDQI